MKWVVVLISLTAVSWSCNQSETVIINPDVSHFVRDIPLEEGYWWNGTTEFMYNFYNKRSKALDLDPLYNGYDSLQIRFWLGHSMAVRSHVVMLKFNKKGWSGELLEYADSTITLPETHTYRDTILVHFRKTVMPKSGWNYLLRKLEENEILSLPNGCDLPKYSCRGIDGIDYIFEIASGKLYRYVSYWEPEWQAEKFPQAAKVLAFSTILEKEFGFEFIR